MKRIILSFLTLIAAFAIGYMFVPEFQTVLKINSNIKQEIQPEYTAAPRETQPITQASSDEQIVAEYDPDRFKIAKKRSQVKLLWESSFHSEFFLNKSGEKWFGLFKDGEKYVLRPTKLKVEYIKEPDLHDIEVSTSDKKGSVFLVRDVFPFREAVIPTVFENVVDEDTEFDPTLKPTARNFEFNDITYSLFVENPTDEEYPGKGSKLVLEANGTRQILRYLKDGCNDCYWTLLWAGDLDLDGKIDLYMDLTHHYNVQDHVLFLSSQAEDGKLVKHVADFYNVGC